MNIRNIIKNNFGFRRVAATLYSQAGCNRRTVNGRGNSIETGVTFRKGWKIRIYGDNNKIIVADSSFLIKNVEITIHGNDNIIELGRDFATDGLRFSIEDNGNIIRLGKHCHGGGNSELAAIEGTSITLGSDCMLSANITVRTGDSHSVVDATSGERINPSKSVNIGNHVWIGNTVIILKGTSIGDGSVVAGGSVVTGKRFPENCVIGGNPARVLKEGVSWKSERI